MDRTALDRATEDLAVSFGISTAEKMLGSLRQIREIVRLADRLMAEEPMETSDTRRSLRAALDSLDADDRRLISLPK